MFDVGFTELLLIGVVALVVIGPERLPDVVRTVGGYVGQLQRFVTGVKRDFKKEMEAGELKKLIGDQKEQIDELRHMVNTTRKTFEKSATDVTGDAKKRFAEIQKAAGHGPQETPVDNVPGTTDPDIGEPVSTTGTASADTGDAPMLDDTPEDRAPQSRPRAAGADEGN